MAFASLDVNHDLFQGITLEVRAELGRKKMDVSEVLTLGVGSVIELSKTASEPLDIRIKDRKIALGDAVVVGDTCGLQITEVLSSRGSAAGGAPFHSFSSMPASEPPPPRDPGPDEPALMDQEMPAAEDTPEPEMPHGPDIHGVCAMWNDQMSRPQPNMTELLSGFHPRWRLAPIFNSASNDQTPYFLLEDESPDPGDPSFYLLPQININFGLIADLFDVMDEAGIGPGTGLVVELLSPATFIEEDPEAFREIDSEHIHPEAMNRGSVRVA